MAWDFVRANGDHVDINRSAGVTDIPDGDWAFAIRFNPDTMGSTFGRLLNNVLGGGTFMFIAMSDTVMQCIFNATGTNIIAQNSSYTPPSGWANLLVGRSGDDLLIYEDTTLVASKTDTTNWGAIAPGTLSSLQLGASASGTVPYDGLLAEIAFWTRFPGSSDRTDLANGKSPLFMDTDLKWYVKAFSGEYQEEIENLTVTNNGTEGATHPFVEYPYNVTDSIGVGLNESTSVQVNVDVDDTTGLILGESATALVSAVVADAIRIVLGEQASVVSTVTASDSISVILQEAAVSLTTLSVADAVKIVLAEDYDLFRSIHSADTIEVHFMEALKLARSILMTGDTINVILDDAAKVDVSLSVDDVMSVILDGVINKIVTTLVEVADTLGITLSEAATIVRLVAVSDTASIRILEGGSLVNSIVSISDTLGISIQDAAVIYVTLTPVSDDIIVRILDAAVIDVLTSDHIPISASDVMQVVMTSATTVFKEINLDDTVRVRILDQLDFLSRTIHLSDDLALGVVDQIKVVKTFGVLSDILRVTMEDFANVSRAITVQDLIDVIVTEGSTEIVEIILEVFQGRLRTEYVGSKTPGPYTLRPPHNLTERIDRP